MTGVRVPAHAAWSSQLHHCCAHLACMHPLPQQDEGEEDEDGLALGDGAQTPDLEASAVAVGTLMCSCCAWYHVQLRWLVSCAVRTY